MKKILCLICALVFANTVFAYTYVRGHYRSNPTSYGMNINPQNSNNYRQQYGNKDPYHNYFSQNLIIIINNVEVIGKLKLL